MIDQIKNDTAFVSFLEGVKKKYMFEVMSDRTLANITVEIMTYLKENRRELYEAFDVDVEWIHEEYNFAVRLITREDVKYDSKEKNSRK